MSFVTIRDNKLFCTNCKKYGSTLIGQTINKIGVISDQFSKQHEQCEKVDFEPVDLSQPLQMRISKWLAEGNTGVSSLTILCCLTNHSISDLHYSHPHDPADFRRCVEFFDYCPELKSKLSIMKAVSNSWAALVNNWDELESMLADLIEKEEDNGMYDFMQTLIKG